MPSARQVTFAKFRVTVMIGSAIGILWVLVYLLLGGSEFYQPAVTVRTYMEDLGGLVKGSVVQFNGIRVGKVTSFGLSRLKDPHKVVRVDMSIIQHFLPAIPEDSTVKVSALNVLGDTFANIDEGKSPRHLQPGGELVSPPQPQINTADLIKAARQILERVDNVFSDIQAGQGEFGKFVKGEEVYNKALKKVSAFQRQVHAMTANDTQAGRLLGDETLYDELHTPIKRLDERLSEIQAGQGAGGKLLKDPAQYDQLRKSIGDLDRALEDLRAGKGQAGKLLKDDEQYRRIKRMIDRLNDQVDALNASHFLVSSQLYESLHGSTERLQAMLRELRGNPKKFLWMKVF
jgi:phospholipid/cholesterol/gamma-HCH transport system substrate-binding protein